MYRTQLLNILRCIGLDYRTSFECIPPDYLIPFDIINLIIEYRSIYRTRLSNIIPCGGPDFRSMSITDCTREKLSQRALTSATGVGRWAASEGGAGCEFLPSLWAERSAPAPNKTVSIHEKLRSVDYDWLRSPRRHTGHTSWSRSPAPTS